MDPRTALPEPAVCAVQSVHVAQEATTRDALPFRFKLRSALGCASAYEFCACGRARVLVPSLLPFCPCVRTLPVGLLMTRPIRITRFRSFGTQLPKIFRPLPIKMGVAGVTQPQGKVLCSGISWCGSVVRPFFVPRSCMPMGSTQSGSCYPGVRSLSIQATPQEIRPEGSCFARFRFREWPHPVLCGLAGARPPVLPSHSARRCRVEKPPTDVPPGGDPKRGIRSRNHYRVTVTETLESPSSHHQVTLESLFSHFKFPQAARPPKRGHERTRRA